MATQHTARSRRSAARAPARVARKLRLVAERLRDTADELSAIGYIGIAGEMRGAAHIAAGWAVTIETETAAVQP